MSRPRLPVAAAEMTGATLKVPQAKSRPREAKCQENWGSPPYLTEDKKAAWELFVSELPWLGSSDRAVLELAVTYRATRMSGQSLGINATTEYRQLLGRLGATPSDRSKINVGEDENVATPEDKFFN